MRKIIQEKFECPVCGFNGNTSEMIYVDQKHTLNCPACITPIFKNFHKEETRERENIREMKNV
jgi:uncharacterized Zn finger protein